MISSIAYSKLWLPTKKTPSQELRRQRRRAAKAVHRAQFYKFSWANQTKCGMNMPWLREKGTFPEPVKKLFFQTKLLTANAAGNLPPKEWIDQAEVNLAAYEEWATKHLLPLQGGNCCRKQGTCGQ